MLLSKPHRRFNPLKNEWILISPQRTSRPWKGHTETIPQEKKDSYDPQCYLCPGNTRANGEKNPLYEHTYIFPNDFPALVSQKEEVIHEINTLFNTESASGECRVLCFSPLHNITLVDMNKKDIVGIFDRWISQYQELGKIYQWVQIFENKGDAMGASSPHPHSQIWASNFLPTQIALEDTQQKKYYETNKSPLLADYAQEEIKKTERIVVQNDHWVILVPFWATWPFEAMILPKFHLKQMADITPEQKKTLAEILKTLLTRYDALFATSFPYSMGIHQAPFTNDSQDHWQFHMHFYPPLLRSATVKKFMVGYELLAESQRDITPEQAAERLRELEIKK